MVCTRPSCLLQSRSPIHCGSGRATSIDQSQSPEAGPACKVGRRGLGQQLRSREATAPQAAFYTTACHYPAPGLAGVLSVLLAELKARIGRCRNRGFHVNGACWAGGFYDPDYDLQSTSSNLC